MPLDSDSLLDKIDNYNFTPEPVKEKDGPNVDIFSKIDSAFGAPTTEAPVVNEPKPRNPVSARTGPLFTDKLLFVSGNNLVGTEGGAVIPPRSYGVGRRFGETRITPEGEEITFAPKAENPLVETALQFTDSLANMLSFGAYGELFQMATGQELPPPEGLGQHVGSALGSLAGLITGPGEVASGLLKPVERYLPRVSKELPLFKRLFGQAVRESVHLGTAIGLSETGGALIAEDNFSDAAGRIFEATASGALTGAIFGSAKGLFPDAGIAQRAARITTGLVGLNALRTVEVGGNPFTNRPASEVIFDTLLDTYFLWKGLPEDKFTKLDQDLTKISRKTTEFLAKQENVNQIPDEALKRAEQAKLDVEKKQLELEAEQVAKKAKKDLEVEKENRVKKEELDEIEGEKLEPPDEVPQEFYDEFRATKPDKEVVQSFIDKINKGETGKADEAIIEAKAKSELEKQAKPKARRKRKVELTEQDDELIKKINELRSRGSEEKFKSGKDLLAEKYNIQNELQAEALAEIRKEKAPKIEPSEPRKPIDDSIGIEKPEEIVGEKSIFLTDRETAFSMREMLDESRDYARNYKELADPNTQKDPSTTLWKLTNDVNLWLHGENVDIEKTRNFLSDIAVNADNFGGQIDPKTAQEAADWARNVKRSKGPTLTSVFFGLPLDPDSIARVKDWYSALKRTAEERLPRVAFGQQIINTLRKNSTKDEWESVGLETILDPRKKYPKEEVSRLIDEGSVEFKDVLLDSKGPSRSPNEITNNEIVLNGFSIRRIKDPEGTPNRYYYQVIRRGVRGNIYPTEGAAEIGIRSIIASESQGDVKYSQYQEPGGSNYKELFVTAPAKQLSMEEFNRMYPRGTELPGMIRTDFYNVASRKYIEGKRWQDGHPDYADIENPIVRLRMNDRFTTKPVPDNWKPVEVAPLDDTILRKGTEYWRWQSPDGELHGKATLGEPPKTVESKVLFLEELQGPTGDDQYTTSDGRNFKHRKIAEWHVNKRQLPSKEITKTPSGEQAKMPEALRKRIREIGMKRAIKYAIDNGYDKLAWTTGEMQAKRYSLDKYINYIDYRKSGKYDNLDVIVRGKDGNDIPTWNIEPDQLADHIGEELAVRLLDSAIEGTYKQLRGDNLNTGGQGLRKLYDQDLPNVAKKLGGKVEKSKITISAANDLYIAQAESGKYYVYQRVSNQLADARGFETRQDAEDFIESLRDDTNASVPSISIEPFKEKVERQEGFALYSGLPVDEIVKRLRKLHPATYPRSIQKTMAAIAHQLGVKDILDVFGGVGNIGRLKEYGYRGKIRSSEIEPSWGGQDTVKLNREKGVDEVNIGDSRNLPYKANSVQAIFTSPTYGNLMALKSPSKIDSYQALAGGKLQEGNTGGEVWGPAYEQLHKEIYDEAFRVVKPGGFFVLNMKDKPVSATDQKNNWIPKKGSTVEVRDNIMQATEWHIKALEDAGFRYIDQVKIPEAKAASKTHEATRKYTTGYESIVIMGKPDRTGETKSFSVDRLRQALETQAEWGGSAVKLFSGPEAAIYDKLAEGAKKFKDYMTKARGVKDRNVKAGAIRVKNQLREDWTDRTWQTRDLVKYFGEDGYRVLQIAVNSKGANSLAARVQKQMEKEVFGGLNKKESEVLDSLALAERMIDIGKYKTAKQFKFPEGLDPASSAMYRELFQYIEKLPPERAELIKQRVEAYFEWMKKPLKELVDEGLITQQEYDDLVAHNYRRIKLADVYDKKQPGLKKKGRSIYDSGVEALQRGRETDIYEPSAKIMALEVFNRAYGRILNNRANLELLKFARENKENDFVRVKESDEDHIPNGWTRVFVFEDGKRKPMHLSPEMAKSWITSSGDISMRTAKMLRFLSGSPILRTFATGINWSFALANLPRDIMHIGFAARVFEDGKWKSLYNSNLPVYGMQIGKDISDTFTDAVTRKGRYEDYINEGGGFEFLTHQGRWFQKGRHLEGPLDKFYDYMGWLGETSEIMTRLAVRDRVIKRRAKQKGITYEEAYKDKDIRQEATFAARDYMDFGQGGSFAKVLDNAIPYLNASIQGTRGMFRAFDKDTRWQSVWKVTQFAGLVAGLTMAGWNHAPKAMEAMQGGKDDENNLRIPLGDDFSYIGSDGQIHYIYLKIPLDQSQRYFKTFFKAATNKWLGKDVDVDEVVDNLKTFSPVDTSSLPPSMSAVLGYVNNKDFWTREDIWSKTDKIDPKEEYVPGQTPEFLVDVGQATGLSPERLDYATGEFLTSGTVWSFLVGEGYKKLFGDVPAEQKEQHIAEALARVPGLKRFIGITNPYTQYAGPIDKATQKANTENWIISRDFDPIVDSYLFGKGSIEDVRKYIKKEGSKDPKVLDRLTEDFIFQKQTKDLPNRTFWRVLRRMPTKPRAEMFKLRYDKALEQGGDELKAFKAELGKVIAIGGVWTEDFELELGKLSQENR